LKTCVSCRWVRPGRPVFGLPQGTVQPVVSGACAPLVTLWSTTMEPTRTTAVVVAAVSYRGRQGLDRTSGSEHDRELIRSGDRFAAKRRRVEPRSLRGSDRALVERGPPDLRRMRTADNAPRSSSVTSICGMPDDRRILASCGTSGSIARTRVALREGSVQTVAGRATATPASSAAVPAAALRN